MIEFEKAIKEEKFDPTKQEFTLSTNKILRCKDCSKPIDIETPWLLLSHPVAGSIFLHTSCIGLDADIIDLNDKGWIAHAKKRFIDRFYVDRLYGKRG